MKKKVSLVLGSGGARGYAHIGVIEELEKEGFDIVSISGSSMGALVGGLYAAGKLDEYKKWVLSLDLFEFIKLLDFSFAKNGIIRGDKVFEKIEEIVGDVKIENLSIPFTAVATNLKTQKSVWFQKGSLVDAIRASIAIPTIFTPKKIGDDFLVDGGILNPLPTVPLLASKSDYMIAVNVHSSKMLDKKVVLNQSDNDLGNRMLDYIQNNIFKQNKDDLNSFKLISKSIETMQNQIIRYELAAHSPDLIINIPKNVADFYDFHKAKELIEYGRGQARESLKSFGESFI